MLDVVLKVIRYLFFFLDVIVYQCIEWTYNIILNLSEIKLFGDDALDGFANRIYLLIGVIMLFKVAVSLINYFLNPESFDDTKVGFGSVLKRLVVTLVLIFAVPLIFELAYDFQSTVLKSDLLPSFILGEKGTSTDIKNGGKNIRITLFQAFIDYDGDPPDSMWDYSSTVGDTSKDYYFLISTVTGAGAVYIMVLFCFDIGVRLVKLSFLELISPVSIISYVDPKKGDQVFHKWVSECVSSYLSVFTRLIALYFAIFVISTIMEQGIFTVYDLDGNPTEASLFTRAFIIIGLLLFMKEVPKLICEILGIKDSGGFSWRRNTALLGTGVGAALGGIGNYMAREKTIEDENEQRRLHGYAELTKDQEKALIRNSVIGGAFSAGGRTLQGALASDGKTSARSIIGKAVKTSSDERMLRHKGFGWNERRRESFNDMIGVQTEGGNYSIIKDQIDAKQEEIENWKLQETNMAKVESDIISNYANKGGDLSKFNEAFSVHEFKDENGEIETRNFASYTEYIDWYKKEYNTDEVAVDKATFYNYRNAQASRKEADTRGKAAIKEKNRLEKNKGAVDEMKKSK